MKKILLSIGILAIVGAVIAGATGAFYKDTETSTGNVFIAGTIDLKVDSRGAVYNSDLLNGWELTDLIDERFFDFVDIKPADHGWRNISLHVGDNDAWACLYVDNKVDDENVAIDPELDAGDTTDDGPGYGELSVNTEVFVWQDNDTNGAYNSPGDDALTALSGETLATLSVITIADSTFGTPLTNADTRQIYIALCA